MTVIPLSAVALRVAAVTMVLLCVPLVAMQISDEVRWGAGDFLAAAGLLFGAGMAAVVGARRVGSRRQRWLVAAGVVAVAAAVWAELAVGLLH